MNDGIDYEKAFYLLLSTMVMRTLNPESISYGSTALCLRCMKQGRNFAYGDDGDKKFICDKCVYNFSAYMPNGGKLDERKY